jgi:sugar transferase EpsL
VLGSGVGLVILSPLLGVVALLVAVRLGRPILFRQQRPGRGGRLFELVKFRSMRTASAEQCGTASDGARLTPFGNCLRCTSLDELPTLWNVLRGDMSLVGPRPLLADYLTRYTTRQARRHEVRPGVTGWAQTNGRNTVDWEDRFEMDVWYVDNRSLWLDTRILFRTIEKVCRREGINQPGQATVVEFTGTEAVGDFESAQVPVFRATVTGKSSGAGEEASKEKIRSSS